MKYREKEIFMYSINYERKKTENAIRAALEELDKSIVLADPLRYLGGVADIMDGVQDARDILRALLPESDLAGLNQFMTGNEGEADDAFTG